MAATSRVLDSAEWLFEEYRAEIMGADESEEDIDLLRPAAIRSLSWDLALYWLTKGQLVELVSYDEYGRRTWNDEATSKTASSHILPDADDAFIAWQAIADSITADEIRQFAGIV